MPRLAAAQIPSAGPSMSAPPSMGGTVEELGHPYTADEESPITGDPGGLQLIEPPQNLPAPADDFKPSPAAEIHLRAPQLGGDGQSARGAVALPNICVCSPTITAQLRVRGPVVATAAVRRGASATAAIDRRAADRGAYRMLLADVFLQMKNYEAAREQLIALLADPRYDVQAAILLARTYLAEHRLPDARKDLRRSHPPGDQSDDRRAATCWRCCW